MNTSCPHCSAIIEIDPETHSALAGHSHFACPTCQGAVPVPALVRPRLKLATALDSDTTVSSPLHLRSRPASRSKNRKLTILGVAVLLVLGATAIYLASRKSGDIRTTSDFIRNEIFNNSHFQNLIATGVTTRGNLDAIATIRPYNDGFIGISEEAFDWQQANDLAKQTGAVNPLFPLPDRLRSVFSALD